MLFLGKSNYIQNQLKLKANASSVQPKLNKEDFRTVEFVLPTLEEQKEIEDFLYKKTNEIDSLIQDKENLIELLKEQREAIIIEAITKGLDKNSTMKDSGIEHIGYIGYISVAWEIKN